MNQDNDKQESTEVDPQLSAHYELLAREKTPADLDRAVLHEAARAVRAESRKGSFGAWFRPVAFMATVGLSLVIILDLSDTSIFSPPADRSFETAPPAPVQAPLVQAPAETAADVARKKRAQPATSKLMRQENSESAKSRTTAAPDTSGDVFAAEVESAEQRIREMATAAGDTLQPPPAAAARFAKPQAAIALESLSVGAPPNCSDEQKSAAAEWWQCIKTLRQAGLAEAADLELEGLRQVFRDFEPPE